MEKDWAPRLIRFLEVGDLPSHDMLLYGVELMQEVERYLGPVLSPHLDLI
jgi:hypothetical protein